MSELLEVMMMRRFFAGGFKAGIAVFHRGSNAHVTAFPDGLIQLWEVPIIYDDESGCVTVVHVDDLLFRCPIQKVA